MKQSFEVEYSFFRCARCNQYHAVETRAGVAWSCPYCARARIDDAEERARVADMHRKTAERSARARRGAQKRRQ